MKQKLLIISLAALLTVPSTAQIRKPTPNDTPVTMMEKLDRGLVVIPVDEASATAKHYFASWRYLGTDDTHTTFTILKNGKPFSKATTAMTDATSAEVTGTATDRWQVVTLHDGDSIDVTPEALPWKGYYMPLKLNRPAGGNVGGKAYSYTPNDCSVGDVDGDGQYEIIVKWDPTNSKDNAQTGLTGNVYLDCYKLDGRQLWRVDLGKNIRAGAHYTQFLVYDFNGDGKAEMICKTAPGSIDGTGKYVNQAATDEDIKKQDNSADYRQLTDEGKKLGRVLRGPEYLTVFDGEDGHAIHTIYYNPNRAGGMNAVADHPAKSFWNDDYGNRADRFLAAVAYLDGPDGNPSAVMCRGYYTKSYLWAVDFDGSELKTKWLSASTGKNTLELYGPDLVHKTIINYNSHTVDTPNSYGNTAWGEGAHNLSVGDVDFDGKDEICYGDATVDDDGRIVYSTGLGHGDAQHLGDFDPDRPGLEYFMVHEEAPYGYDLRDAATGKTILYVTGSRDTGRGLIADVDSTYRGAEFTYATQTGTYDIKGNRISGNKSNFKMTMGMNFRIFWDGDPYEELLDGNRITKFSAAEGYKDFKIGNTIVGDMGHSTSCNGTKATPCLSADIFGDWREEVIWWDSSDSTTLNIFSSTEKTDYRVPTLMHDKVYRLGVARENTAYNQPPHLGYYLPDFITSFRGVPTIDGVTEYRADDDRDAKAPLYTLCGVQVGSIGLLPGLYIRNGKKIIISKDTMRSVNL